METEGMSSDDCIEIDIDKIGKFKFYSQSKNPVVSQVGDDDDTPLKYIYNPFEAKPSVSKPSRKRKNVECVNCNFCGKHFKKGAGIARHQKACKKKQSKHRKKDSAGKTITPSDVVEYIPQHNELSVIEGDSEEDAEEEDTKEKIIVISPENPQTKKQRIMDLHNKDTQEKEKEKEENSQSPPSSTPQSEATTDTTPKFQVGDYATIINDVKAIKEAFSKNRFYGWCDKMLEMLGKTYEVIQYSPWSVEHDVVSLLVLFETQKIRQTFPKEVLIKVGDRDSQKKIIPCIVVEDSDDESESESDPAAEIQILREENATLKDKVKLFEESVETLSASVDAVGKGTKRKSQELDPIPKPPGKKANNGEKAEVIPVIKVDCWKTTESDFDYKEGITAILKSVNNPDNFFSYIRFPTYWNGGNMSGGKNTSIIVGGNKTPYQITSFFRYWTSTQLLFKDNHSPQRRISKSEMLKMVMQ